MSDTVVLPSIDEVVATIKGGTPSDPAIPEQGASPEGNAPEPEGGTPGTTTLTAPAEKTEEKKTPAPAPQPAKDTSASRFAALSRKEKEARQREQDANRRLAEAEARERILAEREAGLGRIKQDPIKFLKENGLSFQDIASAAMGNYNAPEEDPLDVKIKPVKEKFDKFEADTEALKSEVKRLLDLQARQEQERQYNQVMGDIKAAVTANPDSFELIGAYGQEGLDLVKDIMVEYWNRNERLLSAVEAAEIAEKHYEAEAERLAQTKKLKSRFAPPAAPAATKQPAGTPKQTAPTLTNKLSSSSASNVDIDKLSREEALEVLSKRLKWNG